MTRPPDQSANLVVPAADSGVLDAARRTVVRAMRIGAWIWPSFTALDAWMCFVAYPGAPFQLMLAYRVLIELGFLGTWRASLHETDIRRLYSRLNLAYGSASIAIALMAVHLGGIQSPYMHGISIVALVRAALVPTHWHRSIRTYGRIGLAFPLVMSAGPSSHRRTAASGSPRTRWSPS